MRMRHLIHLLPAGLLGAGAALLVSCGSSGAGLIPAENAGPLVSDFRAVEEAAKAGNGSCSATEVALRGAEGDFQRLPASVDTGLRTRIAEGLTKLHKQALEECAQPSASATATGASTPAKTAPAPTTSTTEPPSSTTGGVSTSTTGTPSTGTQTSGSEGGTAPGVGNGEGQPGEGEVNGGQGAGEAPKNGAGPSGGTGSEDGGGEGHGNGHGGGGGEQ